MNHNEFNAGRWVTTVIGIVVAFGGLVITIVAALDLTMSTPTLMTLGAFPASVFGVLLVIVGADVIFRAWAKPPKTNTHQPDQMTEADYCYRDKPKGL